MSNTSPRGQAPSRLEAVLIHVLLSIMVLALLAVTLYLVRGPAVLLLQSAFQIDAL